MNKTAFSSASHSLAEQNPGENIPVPFEQVRMARIKMNKIAFLDLEGTLIKGTSWNNVKDKFGADKLSEEYDKLYGEGKIGYDEWRRELINIWKKNKITKNCDYWYNIDLCQCFSLWLYLP